MSKEQRFYKATVEAAFKYGFRNITIKKISAEGECSEALLYRYFSNEEDLLWNTYKYYINEILREFDESLESLIDGDLKVLLRSAWNNFYDILIKMGSATVFCVTYARSIDGGRDGYLKINDDVTNCANLMKLRTRACTEFDTSNTGYMQGTILFYMLNAAAYAAKLEITNHLSKSESTKDIVEMSLFDGIYGAFTHK